MITPGEAADWRAYEAANRRCREAYETTAWVVSGQRMRRSARETARRALVRQALREAVPHEC